MEKPKTKQCECDPQPIEIPAFPEAKFEICKKCSRLFQMMKQENGKEIRKGLTEEQRKKFILYQLKFIDKLHEKLKKENA